VGLEYMHCKLLCERMR